MTLEAAGVELLAVLNALPPVETMTGAEARAASKARRRPPVDVAPVLRTEDRTVPGRDGPIGVRVYVPVPRERGPRPVVVFAHGGGWVTCDLDSHDPVCGLLCDRLEAVVVSVDYRLAPEHPFPAPVHDVLDVTAWVGVPEHAAELHPDADISRLVVAGDSAGGNLAAATALHLRDHGGPSIAAQLLIYPVLAPDFDTPSYRDNATGCFVTRAAMQWFWQQYAPSPVQRRDPLAAPLLAMDLRGLPPAVIVTGQYDPLRDEGEAYAAALERAGVPVWHRRYEAFHGFFTMPLEASAAARAESLAALAERLGVQPAASRS